MTQSNVSPRFATDPLYTSGPESGQPTKIALSSGLSQQGFRPNKRYGAERINYLLANHGDHLDGIIDAHALTWTKPQASNTNALVAGGLIVLGSIPAVAPGTPGLSDVLCLQGAGGLMLTSRDGYELLNKGATGTTSPHRGFAAGFKSDGTTVAIVAWRDIASGTVRASTNYGGGWATAGTLGAGYDPTGGGVGGVHPTSGRFFICGRQSLFFHDTLANTAWTQITTSGFWTAAVSPNAFRTSPTECAIVIGGSPYVIGSTDGIAWGAKGTGLGGVMIDAHWSTSHQLWVAVNFAGNVFTAPAGMASWTDRGDPGFGDTYAVSSLGRTIVISQGDSLYASRNFEDWRPIPLRFTDDGVTTDRWSWLEQLNGRLWAGRLLDVSGNEELESSMSLILPALFDEGGSW